MKRFHSLVFYIKNRNSKLYLNSIISNYVEPICKYLNKKVDKINLYVEILGEENEKECNYNDYSVLNDFYIDSKSEQLQFLSFLSNEMTNDEPDEPSFIIKFIYQYNRLEIRIDYEQKNITFEEYKEIVNIVGEGNYYVYDKKGIIFKCSNYFIKRKINKLLKEC